MSLRKAVVACALACVSACAGSSSFATTFPLGGGRMGEVVQRAKTSARAKGRSVIVGVADAPRSVFAYDLDAGRLLFRANASVVGLPAIAGELVAVPEADKVTVRRLQDGQVVRELPLDGMHLIGADGDAELSAIVLSTGGTMKARSRLVLMHGEQVASDRNIDRALGAPAVLGGTVFVPHNRVNLSAVDAHGQELARIRAQDDVASEAFTRAGEVYFGQRGFYLLDGESERGAKNGAHFWKLALATKLPGSPPLIGDSAEPKPAIESALFRVRLAFAPDHGANGPQLLDDTLYLAFYRQLFALAPDGASARWVHDTDSDLVGLHVVPGGVVAVENDGEVSVLDHDGMLRFSTKLDLLPIAVTIRAERFDQGGASETAAPLAQQLEQSARNPDTRLVPSRAFAAQLLGPVDDDQAASALISLCSDGAQPGRVREDACVTLAHRKQPSDAVLTALEQHANFLEGRSAPPVAPLAFAALHSDNRRAVGGLIAQLFDPATSEDSLPAVMRALGGLGDASAAAALSSFIRLYHAETADETFENVLAQGMDALVKLDKEKARVTLEPIASDPLARSGVRTAAQKRLSELPPPPRGEGDEEGPAATGTSAPADKPEDTGPPANLTSRHVEETLSPVRTQLSRCLHDDPHHPASARLVIVIEGEGEVADVRALPESMQACVSPIVRSVKFPATRFGRRSIMNYSIGL